MSDEALVKNAADAGQVRDASRKERLQRKQELADLKALLSEPAFRRFCWRLFEHCGLYAEVYDDVPQRMARNVGRQAVGRYLLAEITEAQPDAYLTMQREHA